MNMVGTCSPANPSMRLVHRMGKRGWVTPDPEGCQGDTWCKQGGCLEGVRWGEREMGEIEDTRRSGWVSGRREGEGVNPANPLQPVTHPSLSQQSGLPLADPPFPLLPLANIFGYYRLPIFCADAFEM